MNLHQYTVGCNSEFEAQSLVLKKFKESKGLNRHIDSGMALRGTDQESYITEYCFVYEDGHTVLLHRRVCSLFACQVKNAPFPVLSVLLRREGRLAFPLRRCKGVRVDLHNDAVGGNSSDLSDPAPSRKVWGLGCRVKGEYH